MMFEIALIGDAEQGMKQAAVAHINLRGLDLTLAEVLKPRRQLPDHEHAGHQVEVTANRGLVDGEGARQFGGIPNLAVAMGEHIPETPERNGGNGHAKLRQVPFQKSLDKLPPPHE